MKQEYNWRFSFAGMKINAYEIGQKLGIDRNEIADVKDGNQQKIYKVLGRYQTGLLGDGAM